MRLYLDIDGVITSTPGNCPVPIDPYYIEIGDSITVLDWNIAEAQRLFDAFDEVIWASTWVLVPEHLEALEAKLDRGCDGEVPLTWSNYNRSHLSCGKLNAVRQYHEADPQPFIWIDDHMGFQDIDWAKANGGTPFKTDYRKGGIYPHLEEVLAYA